VFNLDSSMVHVLATIMPTTTTTTNRNIMLHESNIRDEYSCTLLAFCIRVLLSVSK